MASNEEVAPTESSTAFDVYQVPEFVDAPKYDPSVHTAELTNGWVFEGANPANPVVETPVPLVVETQDNSVAKETVTVLTSDAETAGQTVDLTDNSVAKTSDNSALENTNLAVNTETSATSEAPTIETSTSKGVN